MNRTTLDKINLDKYKTSDDNFTKVAGLEHYRLLNHVCGNKKLVYDVGTYRGSSALAMSSAKKVISYDVTDHGITKKAKNIKYKIGDVIKDKGLKDADVILLDTLHTGQFESKFYDNLKDIGFKGLLILDDIHLNGEMERFWKSIDLPKEDKTDIGHYSGTGFVYFDGRKKKM